MDIISKLFSGHSRAVVHELPVVVTACIRSARIQARQNFSWRREVGRSHTPSSEVLKADSCWERKSQFSLRVDHSPVKATHSGVSGQHKLYLMGIKTKKKDTELKG